MEVFLPAWFSYTSVLFIGLARLFDTGLKIAFIFNSFEFSLKGSLLLFFGAKGLINGETWLYYLEAYHFRAYEKGGLAIHMYVRHAQCVYGTRF